MAQSPVLQVGSGPLHRLDTQYILDDGASIQVSSRYKPAEAPPTPSSSSRSRSRSRGPSSSQSSVAPLGTWQLVVSRTTEDISAWFTSTWQGEELRANMAKAGLRTLSSLEQMCLQAFRMNNLAVGVLPGDCMSDGSWSRIILIIGEDSGPKLRLTLQGLQGGAALKLATFIAADLCQHQQSLLEALDAKQHQLENSRKLAGITQTTAPHLNASLINPGRMKRKHDDDEGFEGEDEEDDDQGEPGEAERCHTDAEEPMFAARPSRSPASISQTCETVQSSGSTESEDEEQEVLPA
ncbi:unnamed protein product [Parajaminaea phylloscopi]